MITQVMRELDEQAVPSWQPATIELAPGVGVPVSGLRFQFARSSGPGGQNVNKLNTKAELWVGVGAIAGLSDRARSRLRTLAGKRLTSGDEVHLSDESSRSQEGNRQAALARLRELIVQAMHEPKPRRKTKPTASSRRRRLEGKRHRAQTKSGRRSGWDGE